MSNEEVSVLVPLKIIEDILRNLEEAIKPKVVFNNNFEEMKKEAICKKDYNLSLAIGKIENVLRKEYIRN
jgi:hypothetical protein